MATKSLLSFDGFSNKIKKENNTSIEKTVYDLPSKENKELELDHEPVDDIFKYNNLIEKHKKDKHNDILKMTIILLLKILTRKIMMSINM